MIEKLIPKTIIDIIPPVEKLSELRLRIGKEISFSILGKYYQVNYVCTLDDILNVLRVATKNSIYSCEESIANGYIPYYGARIGLAGEGVINKNQLITLKNISSICIRFPHEVEIGDPNINKIISSFDNTIILSRPGMGKTTLLREMIKLLSNNGKNVLVLDERGEISYDNTLTTLGDNTDVILNIPKDKAYSAFVRVLRPDIIATDEIFGEEEVLAIEDSIRCGVSVIATLHTNSISTINSKMYAKLLSYMRYIVILKDVGIIEKIIDRGSHENSVI